MTTSGAPRVSHGDLRANPKIADVASGPCLSVEECTELVATIPPEGWRTMSVVRGSASGGAEPREFDPVFRRGLEQDLPRGAAGAARQRIIERVLQINEEVYGFRVIGFEEPIRVMRYRADDHDEVGDHIDINAAMPMRKLSFSVLLSDPDTYTGGELEFSGDLVPTRAQGSIIVFPSFLRHRVTPVESGLRDVVVGWAVGPSFS